MQFFMRRCIITTSILEIVPCVTMWCCMWHCWWHCKKNRNKFYFFNIACDSFHVMNLTVWIQCCTGAQVTQCNLVFVTCNVAWKIQWCVCIFTSAKGKFIVMLHVNMVFVTFVWYWPRLWCWWQWRWPSVWDSIAEVSRKLLGFFCDDGSITIFR